MFPKQRRHRGHGHAFGVRVCVTITVLALASARGAAAQSYSRLGLGGSIQTGAEAERYLRVLQIAGLTPLGPWSIQPFSPAQESALKPTSPHPWRGRFADSAESAPRNPAFELLRPEARFIGNSTFPFQPDAGPTWAGRGLSGELQAGVAARWRAVHFQVAPLAFVAQNADFTPAPENAAGTSRFTDPRYATNIDAPQRFGDGTYSRVEPGTSFLSVSGYHLLAALSTAPNRWGAEREYPLVLGPNPGGFPSVYAGTSEPLNLWLFRAHARMIWARLAQSKFAAPVAGERTRLSSGLVAEIIPRGVPGLEIGGIRFSHEPWPAGGVRLSDLAAPLGGFSNLLGHPGTNASLQNEMASVFMRWALPQARAEVYGEFYREDFIGKFHAAPGSLIEKPDDYSTFAFGFQRVLSASADRIRVLRGELVNGDVSHQERTERGFTVPLPPYIHSTVTQGHTVNGLLLGSPEAYGGAGWRLGLDDFTPAGRRSITLERTKRFDWLPGVTTTGMVHPDVIYDVRAELLHFDGGREYVFSLIPAIDLNRNLVAGNDVFNLTAAVTVRGW